MHRVPNNLVKNVISLSNKKGQWIYVIGTGHVAKKSCNEVKELIDAVTPSTVFIELCEERHSKFLSGEVDNGNVGAEFRTAKNLALNLKATIVLGDRRSSITKRRFLSGLTFFQKVKLGYDVFTRKTKVLNDDVIKDKNQMDEDVRESGKLCPWLMECITNERDRFMVLEMEKVSFSTYQ